ncbi:Tyrosine-protein phosphatase non-receptor type 9 [Dirofilaria immitis]|nr:Tyrosine-protein phosphatase non-receptor type 9 [Dirofilaria immitis]
MRQREARNAAAERKENIPDVICIDETRVVLQEGQSDYIHANHVKGDPFLNAFICTQGPMNVTVNDFWIMIMQEKVSNIIMLCNIIEAGKNKCFQYWPQEVGSSLTFGDVQVTCAEVNENKDTTFILSILEAENKTIRLNIKHLRWKDWPDRGVPSSVLAPFRILKIVRQSLDRATVVHCSAGIGRTGCIVAIEMSLQQILSGKPLSIIDMVKRLRSMRMSAIQTDEQLVYVVRCLIAYADACGLLNSKPELQEVSLQSSEICRRLYCYAISEKTITPVEKKIILPEVQPIEEPVAVKVEERQEEPSQKSRQSLQDALEPDETALRLNLLKTALKQAQPLQMSEPVLSPSVTPIDQPQKVAELAPSPFVTIDQKLQKVAETVPSPSATPIQNSETAKAGESPAPLALTSVTPVQKHQKAGESVSQPSTTPLQKPQKADESVLPPSATPDQKQQKITKAVLSPSVAPIQQLRNGRKTNSTTTITFHCSSSTTKTQPIPSPSTAPVQQQKQIQPVPSSSTVSVQQQKQIQSVPPPSIAPVQQQKQIQPIPSPSAVPVQQQKQIQSIPLPSIAPVQKPQKQASLVMKTDWKLSQKQPLTAQQQESQIVHPSQQPEKLQHMVDRKLKQSVLPLESVDSKNLLSKPLSPVVSPAAKAPNNEPNNAKR